MVDFCRRMRPRLVGALGFIVREDALADDVAQEALARAWDRWDRVRAMPNPEGWVYRVALNLARSRLRQRAARRARELRVASREPGSSGAVDVASAMAVREAVAQLPLRQRMVVALRYFDDLSVADTAAAMRCAEGTVKSLTHQALAALRAHPDLYLEETDGRA